MKKLLRISSILILFSIFLSNEIKSQEVEELYYDDGNAEFSFVGIPGTIGAVRFTSSQRVQITKLKFHLIGEMKEIRVHVLDSNFNAIYSKKLTPYSGWFEVDISSEKIFVDGEFYIGFQWLTESPDGPWLGVDSTPPHHKMSYIGRLGWIDQKYSPKPDEDYMIRVEVRITPTQTLSPTPTPTTSPPTTPPTTQSENLKTYVGIFFLLAIIGLIFVIVKKRQKKKSIRERMEGEIQDLKMKYTEGEITRKEYLKKKKISKEKLLKGVEK